MKDIRYLKKKDKFLKYAYFALADHFPLYDDFINYFNAIKTDEQKNLFLKTASFYLFLVKNGDWHVDIPDSNKVIDYLTNTYKYMSIFSLIESLSEVEHKDFYEFLGEKTSQEKFPINKSQLNDYYMKYKDDFGSIKRCISFFRALSPDMQNDLISKLEVREGTNPSIEKFAKYLYDLRSKFVHETRLVLQMSVGRTVSSWGKKLVVCNLSIKDAMMFFEEGLLSYFRETHQEHKN